jgi:hypothetical protein
MSDYIKREAVCKDCNNRAICIDKSCCPVGRAIAVDVVSGEVYRQTVETLEKIREEANMRYEQAVEAEEALADVNARKHGKWLDTREFCGDYMCSNCEALYGTNKFNFCPNCGADMRGESHES